jgi:hypothetical protein
MWLTGAGGNGPDEEFFRRMGAPDNEIPVLLPVSALLARTDDVALALLGVHVYTTGLTFGLSLRVHPDAVARLGARTVWPHHRMWHDDLLVGVELVDGRRATAGGFGPLGLPDQDVVLHQAGGGGGDTAYDQSYWLNPLPPEGPVRVVVRCGELGIEDISTELDGAAIRAAAEQVVELWPWAPPRHDEPEPPPPDVPPGSWFAG